MEKGALTLRETRALFAISYFVDAFQESNLLGYGTTAKLQFTIAAVAQYVGFNLTAVLCACSIWCASARGYSVHSLDSLMQPFLKSQIKIKQMRYCSEQWLAKLYSQMETNDAIVLNKRRNCDGRASNGEGEGSVCSHFYHAPLQYEGLNEF